MVNKFAKILFILCCLFVNISNFVLASEAKSLSKTSNRIVSLAPNLTEIMFALNLEKELVGVTNQCDFPAEVKNIPKIGDMSSPNVELIIATKPSLVLATEGNSREVLAALAKYGIKTVEVHASSAQELPKMILNLAVLLNREPQGIALSNKIKSSLAQMANKKNRGNKSFLLVFQFNPIISATSDTWLGDLLQQTGYKNIVPPGKIKYPQLSTEFAIEKNPDIIFIDPMILSQTNKTKQLQEAQINIERIFGRTKNLPHIVLFPPDILVRPGPRLLQGIEFLNNL